MIADIKVEPPVLVVVDPDEIAHAVDVNSRRAGTYLAGSGQMIVTPDALKDLKPDYVVLMNPIYHEEISADLRAMNLAPEVVLVESPPA